MSHYNYQPDGHQDHDEPEVLTARWNKPRSTSPKLQKRNFAKNRSAASGYSSSSSDSDDDDALNLYKPARRRITKTARPSTAHVAGSERMAKIGMPQRVQNGGSGSNVRARTPESKDGVRVRFSGRQQNGLQESGLERPSTAISVTASCKGDAKKKGNQPTTLWYRQAQKSFKQSKKQKTDRVGRYQEMQKQWNSSKFLKANKSFANKEGRKLKTALEPKKMNTNVRVENTGPRTIRDEKVAAGLRMQQQGNQNVVVVTKNVGNRQNVKINFMENVSVFDEVRPDSCHNKRPVSSARGKENVPRKVFWR